MNCNIILDLLPLYMDGCCSPESTQAVKEHTEHCRKCRQVLTDLADPTALYTESSMKVSTTFRKIEDWKASILQSALLFLSFAIITLGVALEAKTPMGPLNGLWAQNLIIPATGFMLSLANWYFIRVYRNKKIFSTCSLLTTLSITLGGYLWSFIHYGNPFTELFADQTFRDILSDPKGFLLLNGLGLLLTVVFSLSSKILSHRYANLLGKE